MNELSELRWKAILRKAVGDEPADVLLCKKREGNVLRSAPRLHIELEREERMRCHLQLGRAIYRNDKKARALQSREDISDEIDSRHVCPVYILDEKHQRLLQADLLEKRGELALESLLRLRSRTLGYRCLRARSREHLCPRRCEFLEEPGQLEGAVTMERSLNASSRGRFRYAAARRSEPLPNGK